MTAGRHVNTLSQSWGTPPKYVNAIKTFWGGHIGLDPCSNEYSVVFSILCDSGNPTRQPTFIPLNKILNVL